MGNDKNKLLFPNVVVIVLIYTPTTVVITHMDCPCDTPAELHKLLLCYASFKDKGL